MKKEKLFYTYIYTSVLEGLLNILTASSMMRDLWAKRILFALGDVYIFLSVFYLNNIGSLYTSLYYRK